MNEPEPVFNLVLPAWLQSGRATASEPLTAPEAVEQPEVDECPSCGLPGRLLTCFALIWLVIVITWLFSS